MKRKAQPTPDDAAQSKSFIEKAREIGADEDNSNAEALIGWLTHKPPQPRLKAKKRRTKPRPSTASRQR